MNTSSLLDSAEEVVAAAERITSFTFSLSPAITIRGGGLVEMPEELAHKLVNYGKEGGRVISAKALSDAIDLAKLLDDGYVKAEEVAAFLRTQMGQIIKSATSILEEGDRRRGSELAMRGAEGFIAAGIAARNSEGVSGLWHGGTHKGTVVAAHVIGTPTAAEFDAFATRLDAGGPGSVQVGDVIAFERGVNFRIESITYNDTSAALKDFLKPSQRRLDAARKKGVKIVLKAARTLARKKTAKRVAKRSRK